MHILIADDNALTLRFLAEAAAQLGHRCDTTGDGGSALALARAQRFDLLLLDRHMPGLDGPGALQRLRADSAAASQHAPALATTADPSPELLRQLHQQGFDNVLTKPLDFATLEHALDRIAPRAGGVAEPIVDYAATALLDDAAACRSLGSLDNVVALRQLFRGELEALPAELDACQASTDCAALRERLHRLCASAGFCGAIRLEQACRRLRARLDQCANFTADDLDELRTAARQTLQLIPLIPA